MRDINVVLREKEDAIQRVKQEVQALRSVTPLLADAPSGTLPAVQRDEESKQLGEALCTAASLLGDQTEVFDSGIRARLVEAAERDQELRKARKISCRLKHLVSPLVSRHRWTI